ncbi:MAG: hypothetical protein JW986_04695 [Methanotrichaceae archaeon]|nr:hypothetical protein [Methanotrichaceae archaeon]
MDSREWQSRLSDLEAEAEGLEGRRERAKALKARVELALSDANDGGCPTNIAERLDLLLMLLSELSRENVCTNTRCPHYYRRCKMR